MKMRTATALCLLLSLLACGRRHVPFAEGPYRTFKAGTFELLVANTPRKADHGLMYVTHIPENKGMVFVQAPKTPAVFWMRGCSIQMDLVFIGPNGEVQQILTAQPTLDATPDKHLPIYTAKGVLTRDQVLAEGKRLVATSLVIEVAYGMGARFAQEWRPEMISAVANATGEEWGF